MHTRLPYMFIHSTDAEDGEAGESEDDREGGGRAEGEHGRGGRRHRRGFLPSGAKVQHESPRPAQQAEGGGQRSV